jgi:hypothetical protein
MSRPSGGAIQQPVLKIQIPGEHKIVQAVFIFGLHAIEWRSSIKFKQSETLIIVSDRHENIQPFSS